MSRSKHGHDYKHDRGLPSQMDNLLAVNSLPQISDALNRLYNKFSHSAYVRLTESTNISTEDLKSIASGQRTDPLPNSQFVVLAKAAKRLAMG